MSTKEEPPQEDDKIVNAWLTGSEPPPPPESKNDDDPNQDKKEDTPPPPPPPPRQEVPDGPEDENDMLRPRGAIADRVFRDRAFASEKPKSDEEEDKPGDEEDDDDEEGKKKKVDFRLPLPNRKEQPTQTPPVEDTNPPPSQEPEISLNEDEVKSVDNLSPEMQDAMDFYLDAERVDPEKYKGKAKKYFDYARAYDSKVAELKQDDPDFDPTSSPELREWVRSQDRPSADRREMRRIEKLSIRAELEREQAKKDAERDRQLRAMQEKPKVEKDIAKFAESFNEAIPEDVAKIYAEAVGDDTSEQAAQAGYDAVADEYGDEVANLIREVHEETVTTASAYLNCTRGIEAYDPNNPNHAQASNMVVRLGQQILSNPKLAHLRQKDGRTFVPREKFFTLPPEERAKSYTLSDEDVLNYIRVAGKTRLENEIDDAKKTAKEKWERRLKRRGIKPSVSDAENTPPPDPPPTRQPSKEKRGGADNALAEFFIGKSPD